MTKAKSLILLFLLMTMFNSLNGFTNSEGALRNLASPVTMRELLSAPNTWYSQTAVVYSDSNFGGIPSTILTGQPQPVYSKYVSFQVGPSATLRIVDVENYYVYRFAPGTAKERFEIDSNNWYATVDQPVAGDNCAMMFQYPRYHGYYEEFCVDTTAGNNFYQEELFCQFSSIVFGKNSAAVAILLSTDRRSFLPLDRKRNFTGIYNHIYLFSSLDAQYAYMISTTDNSVSGVEQNYGNVATQSWPTYSPGPYIMVAGGNVYAKAAGQAVSFAVSGNRPYRYFNTVESLTVYVRDLYANPPSTNQVYTYGDYEGFTTATTNSYTGSTTGTYTSTNFRNIRFGSSIRGVYLYLNNNSHIYLGGGPVPSLNRSTVSSIAIVPFVDDNNVFFYSATDFLGTRSDLSTSGISSANFDPQPNHFSLIVGRNVRRFGFYDNANDATTQQVAVYPPGVYPTDQLPYDANWRISRDIFSYLSTFIDDDCIRVYTTSDFTDYTEFCTDEPENYPAANLVNAQAIIFPTTKNFNTVLLFQSVPDANGNNLEMNIVGNTIFSTTIYNVFNRITLVPNVPSGNIYLYNNLFYSGPRTVLSSGSYVYEVDTTSTTHISTLFEGVQNQSLGRLRLINTTTRHVTTYTSSVKSVYVENMNIYLQAGEGTLINGQTGAVWMFDRDSVNNDDLYNMRVLTGREFFEGNMISSNVRFVYFPIDNSIAQVYLFQGDEIRTKLVNNSSINTLLAGVAYERSVILPSGWNKLLLFEGHNMNKFLCTLEASVVVKLEKRIYSYITSLTSVYRLYNFELIGRNDFTYGDVNFIRAVQTINPLDADKLQITECGYYAFTREGEAPKSTLLDCIFVFEGCDYDPSKGFYKYCTKNYSYNKFDITVGSGTSQIGIVISQPIEGKHHFRSYNGITVDGELIDKTRCVTISGSTVQAFFRR